MSEYVEFGDYKLVRTTLKPSIVAWVSPCGCVFFFKEDEEAELVRVRIKFHLIICEKCHAAST